MTMPDPFTRPADQLGIVVPDLEAEIGRWLAKGVGPFFTIGGAMLSHHVYRGRGSSPRVSAAFGQVGPLQLELIQPVDDEPSVYRDFVEAGGSGLHHLGWFTEDLDADRAAAEGGGCSLLQTGTVLGTPFAYYELGERGAPAGPTPQGLDGEKSRVALDELATWDGAIGRTMEGAFELQTLAQRVGRWFRERT